MIKKEELVKIGQFAKPHGIKGELSLVTQSDVLEDRDNAYILCEIEGIMVPFFVESLRSKSGTVLLVKLENIDTEDAAREFVNMDVYCPLNFIDEDELVEEMTWDNFIGYEVTDEKHGILGLITQVDESTQNVLFQIDYEGQELLIPAVEELIFEIDPIKKQLKVALPEGLLEL